MENENVYPRSYYDEDWKNNVDVYLVLFPENGAFIHLMCLEYIVFK